MSRHRSPQGRRAHPGPSLSALAAAAGAGGAHRSVSLPQVVPTPSRAIAALVVGGALAAAGQQVLSTGLPAVADGVAAVRLSFERAVGLAPISSTVPSVAPATAAPTVADAAGLVGAAGLGQAAAPAVATPGTDGVIGALDAAGQDGDQSSDPGVAAALARIGAATSAGHVQVIAGPVTSGFGARWGSFHEGLDVAAPIGTPIHVPLAGVVISSGPASGFGLWVRVQHADGAITVYGHINRSFVQVGQHVAAGDVIAETGNRGQSTGPHLHIGVMVNGVYINPRPWLDARGIRY